MVEEISIGTMPWPALVLPLLSYNLLALLLALLFVAFRILRPALGHVPGPLLTRFTTIPLIYQDMKRNRTFWTLELHERYGPIVRLSPGEISCCSPAALWDVYFGRAGSPAFPKGPLYNHLMHFGARNTSSSIYPGSHLFHRKLVGALYTRSAIASKEAVTGNLWCIVGKYMSYIKREGVDGHDGEDMLKAVDIYRLNTFYAADTATSHLFSEGSASLDGDETARRWVRATSERKEDIVTYFSMQVPLGHRVVRGVVSAFRALFHGSSATTTEEKVVDRIFSKYLEERESLQSRKSQTLEHCSVAVRLAAHVINGEAADGVEDPIGEDRGLRVKRAPPSGQQPGEEIGRWIRDESAAAELSVNNFFW